MSPKETQLSSSPAAVNVLDPEQGSERPTPSVLNLTELQARLRRFSIERGWEPWQSPKNLAMAMMVEAAELLEIFQWMSPEASRRVHEHPDVQTHLGEEMADVILYLTQIADRCGVDLPSAIDRKLGLNALKYPVPQSPGPLIPKGVPTADTSVSGAPGADDSALANP